MEKDFSYERFPVSGRTVRYLMISILCLATNAGSVGQGLAAAGKPLAVVELFTSQGCSSCPPADKFLGELAQRQDIIALTEAVDYWDYLGWKDENARHDHSVRQKNYAYMRGDRRVYTPQMVVNGRVHVVGSRRDEVEDAIQTLSQGAGALSVSIDISAHKDLVSISIAGRPDGAGDVKDGTLFLVPFKRQLSVDILRGENRGRSITYHNVVRGMQPIGMWHGEAIKVELPISEFRKGGYDGCAVLLQADVGGLPGPIYGASMVDLE